MTRVNPVNTPPISRADPSRRVLATVRSIQCATRASAFVALAVTAAACGNDGMLNSTPQPPRGIVVLDGFIQPGLTLLADSGSSTSRIVFGAPTEFDAGGFTIERDTVLATSSRAAGDLLYIADITTGTMRRLQLPIRSNPAKARLFKGSNGAALIGVALRDSSSVALVSVSGASAPSITRIANAGQCPTDVFQYDNATWVVDANANCRLAYTVLGDVRLIRIPTTGTARDTIVLTGVRGSGAAAVIVNDVAYVSAGGDASFTSFPYTLVKSGALARVDLKNRKVMQTRAMPFGTYGGSTKLGLDGFLYVSLYQDLAAFEGRVLKLRQDDLGFVSGVPAVGVSSWLTLTSRTGAAVTCGSAEADALGRLHCIANGAASATSLIVFDINGHEVRRVAAGQGGVDLALR